MTADYSSEYPYFIYPAVMALRRGVEDPEEAARLRRIIAANVGDIPSLRVMLGIDPEEFASFYPDLAAPELSTNDTISSFLSHFGREEMPLPQAAAEIPEIGSEIPELPEERPVGIKLSKEGSVSIKEAVARIIDDDGEKIAKEEQTATSATPPEAIPMAPTEQNARLLIKKRDYQGALEIIQQLSLNIPEKSIYFADQIRFLKKLIVNEARKNM